MLENILLDIENNKDEIIKGLMEFVRMPSSDGDATTAQVFVEKMLKELNFEVETFSGIDEKCYALDDYCKPDIIYHKDVYNVAGVHKSNENHPSLMLFAHIDTESKDYFGKFDDPYASYIEDHKIYGLGSSDDKGGIAMMLYALKYVQKHMGNLPYDCSVLSILGKHGGAMGTLSALMKGYRGDYSLYLHPAETGHGFAEIKNISLGVVDLDISVKGKLPALHDDLDTGVNANVLLSRIVNHLEDYNQMMREKYKFDFGSFKGEPSYILNVGSIKGESGYGGVNQNASMKVRIRFFHPLTIKEVVEDLSCYLYKCIEEYEDLSYDDLMITRGNFNASPAIVYNEAPFVRFIEEQIHNITGIDQFIHQYHGGSDIRLPILYANSQCVGIGPYCHLPLANEGKREFISIDDYIQGVKIVASLLYHFKDFK